MPFSQSVAVAAQSPKSNRSPPNFGMENILKGSRSGTFTRGGGREAIWRLAKSNPSTNDHPNPKIDRRRRGKWKRKLWAKGMSNNGSCRNTQTVDWSRWWPGKGNLELVPIHSISTILKQPILQHCLCPKGKWMVSIVNNSTNSSTTTHPRGQFDGQWFLRDLEAEFDDSQKLK